MEGRPGADAGGDAAEVASLLGIRQVALAVNKLDLVDFSEGVFEGIAADFMAFAAPLGFAAVTAIPMSARFGDNVDSAPSARLGWYSGPTLLGHLETVDVGSAAAAAPFRFPVQWVNRPNSDFRGFAGTVASGSIAVGDAVLAMGSDRATYGSRRSSPSTAIWRAPGLGDAVTLTVADDIDVSRGDLLVDPEARAEYADQFAAQVIWFQEERLVPGRSYWLKLGSRTVLASVTTLKHRIDVDTGAEMAARTLGLNEIRVLQSLDERADRVSTPTHDEPRDRRLYPDRPLYQRDRRRRN